MQIATLTHCVHPSVYNYDMLAAFIPYYLVTVLFLSQKILGNTYQHACTNMNKIYDLFESFEYKFAS